MKKINVEIEKYKDDETRVGHQLVVNIIKSNKNSNVVNKGKTKKAIKRSSGSNDPFVRRSELHAELDAAVASIRKDMVTHEELDARLEPINNRLDFMQSQVTEILTILRSR